MKFTYTILLATILSMSSCAHRLVGTWNVEKYQSSTPGERGVTVSNIGTITFNKNGEGRKTLEYSLLGVSKKDRTPFTWKTTDEFVTIKGEDSELTKTWIFIENKRKYQKWQSTDGANNVQTLELVKN